MIAVDSSVAIAAFGEWHELHSAAMAALDEGAALPAHAVLETYSVLTGFPPPHRAPPAIVQTWLLDRFPTLLPSPTPDAHAAIVEALASAGRIGGAIYDGLIGITAKQSGVSLVTADERALPIYELLGVDVRRLVGS